MTAPHLSRSLIQYGGLSAALLAMVAAFSLGSENFFQTSTLISIANQIPELTFLAVGMTFVLIVRGIDLSVGSLLALSAATLGVLMARHGWPLPAALAAAAAVGALCGVANGALSVGFGIPSFIVTLGMLEVARGVTKKLTDSQSVYLGGPVEAFGEPLGALRVSPAFLTAALTVAIGQFVLTRTVFGRYCTAVGTNEEAVRMSGVRPAPYFVAAFALSGVMCSLAGFAQTSRLSTVDPNGAVGIELSAIAACVIGGTSLMGGRGSVVGSFLGVLVIQVMQTGLAQMGVSDADKQIVTGLVIVAAVLFDALRVRLGPRS
ncbi:ABC transporter permease [Alienimonas californiensis]|uniref:Ribose transport system permease protein RbsC n=1 Tax=Alienimonas californiensis TaxID=2527989 RepID=A0A517P8Q5_9PLAN|nr:ABC transporter permease [Alienimonas californiensis]QDT15745.1 Ribose transport system permease protein RbsC [Alienimonas californiensis]